MTYFFSFSNNSAKALNRNRTDDLILTKNALYQLSYEGSRAITPPLRGKVDSEGFEPPKALAS
jgi:hypothetical protein